MSSHPISSATVSFGLVSIPVKIYSTRERSNHISFHMLHEACGARIQEQYYCPVDKKTVDRSEMCRGYEVSKGQMVKFSREEFEALQETATDSIELAEFISADEVDPMYFDKSYFLGPDRGGDKAYWLLAEAMTQTHLVGLARYASRGKQYLVLIRPHAQQPGLLMHQLRYADEIKSFDDIVSKHVPAPNEAELELAKQLIAQRSSDTFTPQIYQDDVKKRMIALIDEKIAGKEIVVTHEAPPQAEIIDLMEALKKSLGAGPKTKPATRASRAKEDVA